MLGEQLCLSIFQWYLLKSDALYFQHGIVCLETNIYINIQAFRSLTFYSENCM